MKIANALVVYTASSSAVEKKSIAQAMKALRDHGIRTKAIERSRLSISLARKADVLVAVGGDGTFLYATHFLPEGMPIIGVNSNPLEKEGYLLPVTVTTFPSLLKKMIEGRHSTTSLATLECSVNGKKLPLIALNEFYIGAAKSYRTSRYEMVMDGKKEVHRSSGVIAATPVGVNAWARSAGLSIHIPERSFAYVVREPYENKVFSDYRFKKGILKSGQQVCVISKMEDGVVVADSLSSEHALRFNDVVKVGLSKRKIISIAP